VRVDAARAEEALAEVALARARHALAVGRRLDRATAQATRVFEQRRRRAMAQARRAATERQREEALRTEQRRRLALATRLERTADALRGYEEWARSRGLRAAADAGLSVEADRLGHRVDELRHGCVTVRASGAAQAR
jgi:hypothetical protein